MHSTTTPHRMVGILELFFLLLWLSSSFLPESTVIPQVFDCSLPTFVLKLFPICCCRCSCLPSIRALNLIQPPFPLIANDVPGNLATQAYTAQDKGFIFLSLSEMFAIFFTSARGH